MLSIEKLAGFAYVRDLLAQPDAVLATAGRLGRSKPPVLRDRRLLVLTGMGSSFHALYALELKLAEAGIPAVRAETSELVHYMRGLLAAEHNLVAVSQSGRSAETVRLLEMARGPVIGVTNTPGSPLTEAAECVVPLDAGEESTVACKTFVCTLAALEWLGAGLCGTDASAVLHAFRDAAVAARAYLARWPEHVSSLAPLAMDRLFLIGRGPSMASLASGALILKESAHWPAEALTAAAFRHGPLEMVDERVTALVFAGDVRTADLNRKLASDIADAGGRVHIVGEGSPEPAFRIPACAPAARPFLEMLPIQMLSLALAARQDHEPGRFVRLTKITTVE